MAVAPRLEGLVVKISDEAVKSAANAISQSSGMRFDGFWSRVEDLEPEDREYALMEARAALEAAAPHMLIHVHHYDIEKHAASFNEGYETAVTQGLTDDPTLADDWFHEKILEAKAEGWDAAAEAVRNDTEIDQRLYLSRRIRATSPYRSQP